MSSEEYRAYLQGQTVGKLGKMKGRQETHHGTFTIGGKTKYYRSAWEVNIAAYYEFLKSRGEIKDWDYEVDTFWFENIKRGVRSYLPDFKIFRNDDTFYYVEVKGYMDAKSKTKLKRMKLYYPNIEIELLDKARYKQIAAMSGVIPNWGLCT